jgi:hypothetical protein
LRKLLVSVLLASSSMAWAENYLASDATYQLFRVENLPTHNLARVLPKYYEMFSLAYGYRTNSNWGVEIGYQRSKKTSKSANFAANDNILFTQLTSAQTITATPTISGAYLCAVGYHYLSTNSELIGQFGLIYSRVDVRSNSNSFVPAGVGSVSFKASFGYQYKFGKFAAVRALIKYESTQAQKLAYYEASGKYYFKPFYDTWGLSMGLLIRF